MPDEVFDVRMRQRLAARKREKQASLLVELVQNVMDFFIRQLVCTVFLGVIRKVAIEVVAVHASQIATQRDLKGHVQWDAGFHRPPVQAVATRDEIRASRHATARKVIAPIVASSLMKRHESAKTDSMGTLNSIASTSAICATVRFPSTISQMRLPTWFRPSSSFSFSRKRTSSPSTICQAVDGDRSGTRSAMATSEFIAVSLSRAFYDAALNGWASFSVRYGMYASPSGHLAVVTGVCLQTRPKSLRIARSTASIETNRTMCRARCRNAPAPCWCANAGSPPRNKQTTPWHGAHSGTPRQ